MPQIFNHDPSRRTLLTNRCIVTGGVAATSYD